MHGHACTAQDRLTLEVRTLLLDHMGIALDCTFKARMPLHVESAIWSALDTRPRMLACDLVPSQPCWETCTHAPAAMRQCNVYGLKPCLPAGRQTSTGTPGVDFATNNPAKVKTQVCYGTSATTLTSFVAAETEVRYPERFMGSFLVNQQSPRHPVTPHALSIARQP